jgi:hypothetical protein
MDEKPEKINTENPAITVKAFIMMLRPMILIEALVESAYDKPLFI